MRNKRNSTAKMRFACAIVFIVFTYAYVAYYQEDILALTQHVLSGGMTQYSYTVAPLFITLVCVLLQVGIYLALRIKRRFHALTYLPSMLILAIITKAPFDMGAHESMVGWWIAALLCLLLWGAGMWTARQLEPIEVEPHSHGWFSRYMWVNLLQMVAMMLAVIFVANNDRLFHQRMKMEGLMIKKQYDKALEVGERSQETDSSLTMLRIASLYKTGELGDKLFTYPLMGGSKAMTIDSVTVKSLMWKAPQWMVQPSAWMQQHHYKYKLPEDYQLCALLLDKQLDKFVKTLASRQRVDSVKLPTHYKEALVLYNHRRNKPMVEYHDNVMDADFEDYQTLKLKFANPALRQSAVRDTYGNTYWYYYDYCTK